MKKKTLFFALPLAVGLGGVYAGSASALDGDVASSITCEGTECVLNSDASGALYVDAGEDITLNMNGHNITNNDNVILVYAGGKLNLTGTGNITTSNNDAVYIKGEGAEVTLNDNVAIESANRNGVAVGQTNIASAKFTMNGGSITSQEFGIAAFMDSVVTINSGTITTRDNCVVGGNGSATNIAENGITININGGTLTGNITSPGYASCGVYMPHAGNVNISDGTINSNKGPGVVMRAGDLNITGGTINAEGAADFTGKVGDSKSMVPVSAVVFDYDANYPGYLNGAMSGRISGDAVLNGVAGVVSTVNTHSANENIEVTGGEFNLVPEYVATGYDAFPLNEKFFVLATPKTVSEATAVDLAKKETFNVTNLPADYADFFKFTQSGDLGLTVNASKIVAGEKTGSGEVTVSVIGLGADYVVGRYNVTVSEPDYGVLDGDNTEYYLDEGGTLAFRFSGPMDLVAKVYMDGELVDPSNYSLTEGSTIVTFNAEYLATLSEGEHTVMVSYTNGGVATASFTVAESNLAVPNTDASGMTPETGSFTSESEGASTSIATALGVSVFVGVVTTAAGLVVVKRHYNK